MPADMTRDEALRILAPEGLVPAIVAGDAKDGSRDVYWVGDAEFLTRPEAEAIRTLLAHALQQRG